MQPLNLVWYTFFSPAFVSFQQNGAETQVDPGPAGSDSADEKCCKWDKRRETPAEQQYAETSAAGRPVRGVHHWNPVSNPGHQGVCSLVVSVNCCCSDMLQFMFLLLQEAKEQLSPLSVALERLQQEKQELLDRKRQRQEEGQEKVRDAANGNFWIQTCPSVSGPVCACMWALVFQNVLLSCLFSVVNFVRLMP